MAHQQQPPPTILPLLVGLGLLALGLLALPLVLGWLRPLASLAVAGALAVMGALFWLYYGSAPAQRWTLWAGYLLVSAAAAVGLGFVLGFRPSHYIALGAFLLGIPFLVVYVRQVWTAGRHHYAWTALPAGGLLTLAVVILQIRLGWPEALLPGVMTTLFMGGAAATVFLFWYPNRARPAYAWATWAMVALGLLTALGLLITINLTALALPLLLLFFAGYFLARFGVLQWRGPARPARPPAPGHAPDRPPKGETTMSATPAIPLTSPAFAQGSPIPVRHTCDGANLSPPLQWGPPPPGTQSLALICDDPDAPRGIWAHWVLYNLPPTTSALPEGVPAAPTISGGAAQGVNDSGGTGYSGPCPPPGPPHRYFFTLYALDATLALGPGARRADLLHAMEGHVLASGQLMGTYQRQRR